MLRAVPSAQNHTKTTQKQQSFFKDPETMLKLCCGMLFFSTHNNTKTTELVYVELYESMKSMVQSKMFDQNSSKLTTFHIPHTNSRTAEQQQRKLQLLIPVHIHQVNMNSSSIPTPETPFQNNSHGCVQTSVLPKVRALSR